MTRAYYSESLSDFLRMSSSQILGVLEHENQFALDILSRNAWEAEIIILKQACAGLSGHVLFEYTIPRIGRRIDAVLISEGVIFLLEFKVGEHSYPRSAIEQITDYTLDLKNFHQESHDKLLVPILVCTHAPTSPIPNGFLKDGIHDVICCNKNSLRQAIDVVLDRNIPSDITPEKWINSPYKPTPTIIEAAQALYRSHSVEDISRNDAGAINLSMTTQAIHRIIDAAKSCHHKSICFITGVPGAGKTLAGLNIAIERQQIAEDEHAVFLSGNGPLVDVLREALARDKVKREQCNKKDALRSSRAFIQNIHHFRDDAITTPAPTVEKVTVFDEAQRAWTKEMLQSFMARKKGILNFMNSEPDFLISVMDRQKDWAVIICLIGGGQEINTGEAGILEWFHVIADKYRSWKVFVSDQISDTEYTRGEDLSTLLTSIGAEVVPELHLSVSIRSFRNENASSFVKALLDLDQSLARLYYHALQSDYPIVLCRDFGMAKSWVRLMAKGSERYGIVASSGARRIKQYGIWVQSKIDAPMWFLNDRDDVRSSYFLEDTATEFDIQGLELDWAIVCWDADLRLSKTEFTYYDFVGTRWLSIRQRERQLYKKNAYRVLLTRARQGFVIFIPKGDDNDPTRKPSFFDEIYQFLLSIGIKEL